MLKQFLLDVKLHKKDFLLPPLVTVVCFLLGFGFCCLIMFLVDDPGGWVTAGTWMALSCLNVFVFLNFAKYYQEFMLALSMGRTRTSFMVSYALRMLLSLVIGYGLMLALYPLELAVGSKLFAPWPLEEGIGFLSNWWLFAAAPVVAVIVSMFIGAIYSYFGKKALIPVWCVWMGVCVLGPRLLEEEGTLSFVAQFLRALPEWGWIPAGAAALAAMATTVVVLGKKQMVK